jgi:hypothetical protein
VGGRGTDSGAREMVVSDGRLLAAVELRSCCGSGCSCAC